MFYALEIYVFLAIDQPDDWKGIAATGEDCLVLHVVDLIGKLNDVDYTFTADGYICEQHSTPL